MKNFLYLIIIVFLMSCTTTSFVQDDVYYIPNNEYENLEYTPVDETPIDNPGEDGYAVRGLYDTSVDIFSAQANYTF